MVFTENTQSYAVWAMMYGNTSTAGGNGICYNTSG